MRQNTSARKGWEVGIPGCNLNMAVIFSLRFPLHRLSLTAESVLAVDLKKPKVSRGGHFVCDLFIS